VKDRPIPRYRTQRCTWVGSIHGLGWIGSRNLDPCTV